MQGEKDNIYETISDMITDLFLQVKVRPLWLKGFVRNMRHLVPITFIRMQTLRDLLEVWLFLCHK